MEQDRTEVSLMREADFVALLDDEGIVRRGALPSPPRARAFAVFAQRSDARVEAEIWTRHAAQFFDARLELAAPKVYRFDPPDTDAALVVLSAPTVPTARRLAFGRPREDDDLRAAEEADVRAGAAGLGKLAQRCRMVWLVEAEGDADRAALLLSAILASVVLGPILSPDGGQLFGVRTARAKLEEGGPPYR
jgi:hypothetical protein